MPSHTDGETRSPALSSQVCTTNEFNASVVGLVGLYSPVAELMVTSLRFISAQVQVNRTLYNPSRNPCQYECYVATVLEANRISAVPGRGEHYAHLNKIGCGVLVGFLHVGKRLLARSATCRANLTPLTAKRERIALWFPDRACNRSRGDTRISILYTPVGGPPGGRPDLP